MTHLVENRFRPLFHGLSAFYLPEDTQFKNVFSQIFSQDFHFFQEQIIPRQSHLNFCAFCLYFHAVS